MLTWTAVTDLPMSEGECEAVWIGYWCEFKDRQPEECP